MGAAESYIVPEGLNIDRLESSIKQAVKEYFIRVHQRSSCEKSFITTEKVICNNDARRWTQME